MTDSFGGGGLGSAAGSIELDAAGALRALEQVSAGLKNLDSQSRAQGGGLLDWARQNEQAMNTVGAGMLGVGGTILAGFGFGVKGAVDFESAMSNVRAVAEATESEFQALS